MKYIARTRDQSIQGLPKVYYTAHPADHGTYLDSISAQILQRENCAVFYDPDPEHPEEEGTFLFDIETMQLIVIPVTHRFLHQDCRARREVFALAMKKHIPVLPVLEEPGIAADFNRICGSLQYLDPNSKDPTAISFDEKLTGFIKSVLIGDELAARVRAAFDAYIFLSYRKKDRRFAQELMRLIHKNDFCRDIAIWYDEFLVPGENFNNAIAEAMKKSRLFALVVTPNLVNELNYVMTTEYPMALEQEKPILPAEMVATDLSQLAEKYENIPTPTDPTDETALAESLMRALQGVALTENDNDPEHNYFIGLAYLGGIDVEKDYEKAVSILTKCAEQELPEAIEKLVDMYRTGEGVERDYEKAIRWQRRLTEVREKLYREEGTDLSAMDWTTALYDLGCQLFEMRHLDDASEVFGEMLCASEEWYSSLNTRSAKGFISFSYNKLGDVETARGRLFEAGQYYEKSRDIRERLAEESGTPEALRSVSLSYERLGDNYVRRGRLGRAETYFAKSLEIRKKLADQSGDTEDMRDLSVSYDRLGELSMKLGDLDKAEGYYRLSLEIDEELAARKPDPKILRDLSVAHDSLGDVYVKQERLTQAEEHYRVSLELSEKLAEDLGTPQAVRDLSVSYDRLGRLCLKQGRPQESEEYFKRGLELDEGLAQKFGTPESLRDLSVSYENLGSILKQQGRPLEAAEYYRKSLEIDERLARNLGIPETLRDLSVSYEKLGDLCLTLGRVSDAEEHYKKSLDIRERLAAETQTPEGLRDLTVSCNKLGDICSDTGRFGQAREYYDRSLEIREGLAADLGTPSAYDDLAIVYYKAAFVTRGADNQKQCFRKARDIWAKLAEEYPEVEKYRQRRDMAEGYLG